MKTPDIYYSVIAITMYGINFSGLFYLCNDVLELNKKDTMFFAVVVSILLTLVGMLVFAAVEQKIKKRYD